jgi:hypothetical protein
MAGTGYHPEGHRWQKYNGAHARWTCANCATVTSDPVLADASGTAWTTAKGLGIRLAVVEGR